MAVLKENPGTQIKTSIFTKESIFDTLKECHFGLCATSNIFSVINKRHIPKHFIFIDDSRLEAIPRFDPDEKKYTLEGGIMRVSGVTSNYNLGFGNDHNLLGCLSEGLILALDDIEDQKIINVNDQFSMNMIQTYDDFCIKKNIRYGEFKTGEYHIPEQTIFEAIQQRHQAIKNGVRR